MKPETNITTSRTIWAVALILGLAFTASILHVTPSLAQEELSARAIIDKASDQPRPSDSMINVSIKIFSKAGGSRKKLIQTWSRKFGEESKALTRFLEPKDEAGTGFLSWEHKAKDDEQWLFLPSLGKTRQITGGNKNDSFMGTDFTYADLQSKEKDDYTYLKKADEKVTIEYTYKSKKAKKTKTSDYDCYVIESTPKPSIDAPYSKTIAWINKANFVPVKSEYYDKKGKLLKVMEIKKIEQIEGFWTPLVTEMKNLQSETKTILKVSKKSIAFNKGIPEDTFTLRYLEKAN